MPHAEQHELAGKTVQVQFKGGHFQIPGSEENPVAFEVEDWQDRLMGRSWMDMEGNPAAMIFAIRSGMNGIPMDNEVLYGHVNGLGHMVHVSELVLEPASV
jgi:hypothetical protein